MIIDKQNLLDAGACQEGADEAEIICNFPCGYEDSIKKLRDASKNDLAAWMVLFKGPIIQTTQGWFFDKYRAKDINNNDVWVEVKTDAELKDLVNQIQDEFNNLHPEYFAANRLIPNDIGVQWLDVDLDTETEDGKFVVYSFETGINEPCDSLASAKAFQHSLKEKYKAKNLLPQGGLATSADKTESTWVLINYAPAS